MIEFILVFISVLSIALIWILFATVRKSSTELRLKKHQQKEAGLSDLLNYAALVDDGVIVGKNGAFMASWLYRGEDNASATHHQRELVSFRINQALSALGSGWMVHVDAVRRAAPGYNEGTQSHFPDALSAAVDEERRRHFERLGTLYEGFFILTVTWLSMPIEN